MNRRKRRKGRRKERAQKDGRWGNERRKGEKWKECKTNEDIKKTGLKERK